jgi:hypothetical protein
MLQPQPPQLTFQQQQQQPPPEQLLPEQRQQQQLLHRPHEPDPQQPGRKRARDAGPASGSPSDSGTPVLRAALSAGRYTKAVESPSGRADVAAGDQVQTSLDTSSFGDEAARHGPRAAETKPGRGKVRAPIPPGGASGSGPGPLRPSSSSAAGDDADASRPGSLELPAWTVSPDASRLSQPATADKAPKSNSKKHKRSAIDDIFGGL